MLTRVNRDKLFDRIRAKGEIEHNKVIEVYRSLRANCTSQEEFQEKFDAYLKEWDEQNPA